MKPNLSILIIFVLCGTPTWAKRGPAPEVNPVLHDGIIYSAPNDDGSRGYIQAIDSETGEKLWDKTIFKVTIIPFLEKDAQWILISSLKIKDGSLLITDEKARNYSLNLKTNKVTTLLVKRNL